MNKKTNFEKIIAKKIQRKKENTVKNVNFGFSFLGTVSCLFLIPIIFGIFLGQWLDKKHPLSEQNWTLILLFAGLVAGGYNFWKWIQKQGLENNIFEQKEKKDD